MKKECIKLVITQNRIKMHGQQNIKIIEVTSLFCKDSSRFSHSFTAAPNERETFSYSLFIKLNFLLTGDSDLTLSLLFST
jgi:hypothetical protein